MHFTWHRCLALVLLLTCYVVAEEATEQRWGYGGDHHSGGGYNDCYHCPCKNCGTCPKQPCPPQIECKNYSSNPCQYDNSTCPTCIDQVCPSSNPGPDFTEVYLAAVCDALHNKFHKLGLCFIGGCAFWPYNCCEDIQRILYEIDKIKIALLPAGSIDICGFYAQFADVVFHGIAPDSCPTNCPCPGTPCA